MPSQCSSEIATSPSKQQQQLGWLHQVVVHSPVHMHTSVSACTGTGACWKEYQKCFFLDINRRRHPTCGNILFNPYGCARFLQCSTVPNSSADCNRGTKFSSSGIAIWCLNIGALLGRSSFVACSCSGIYINAHPVAHHRSLEQVSPLFLFWLSMVDTRLGGGGGKGVPDSCEFPTFLHFQQWRPVCV